MGVVTSVLEWFGRPVRILEVPRLAPRTTAGRLADVLAYYEHGYLSAAEGMAVLAEHGQENTRLMRLTNSPFVRVWRRFKIWLSR